MIGIFTKTSGGTFSEQNYYGGGGGLNKPIFKSSNDRGGTQGGKMLELRIDRCTMELRSFTEAAVKNQNTSRITMIRGSRIYTICEKRTTISRFSSSVDQEHVG